MNNDKTEPARLNFRVLTGSVIATDPATGQDRTYHSGEVFSSAEDMLRLNGGGGMTPKVERAD